LSQKRKSQERRGSRKGERNCTVHEGHSWGGCWGGVRGIRDAVPEGFCGTTIQPGAKKALDRGESWGRGDGGVKEALGVAHVKIKKKLD